MPSLNNKIRPSPYGWTLVEAMERSRGDGAKISAQCAERARLLQQCMADEKQRRLQARMAKVVKVSKVSKVVCRKRKADERSDDKLFQQLMDDLDALFSPDLCQLLMDDMDAIFSSP